MHGCIAGLQSAGLLSCLRARGVRDETRTRFVGATYRSLSRIDDTHNSAGVGLEPTITAFKARRLASLAIRHNRLNKKQKTKSEIDDSNVGPLAPKASVLTPELIPDETVLATRVGVWLWLKTFMVVTVGE